MPVYEYQCNNCGRIFELTRSFSEEEKEVKCPKCGAEDAQRIYSVFSMESSCKPSPTRRFG